MSAPLTLTYLANAGGVLSTVAAHSAGNSCDVHSSGSAGDVGAAAGSAVGIDVFPYEPEGIYPDLTGQQLRSILDRIASGKIRCLLFTHHHPDHFCLQYALAAADAARKNGNRLCMITTRQTARMLLAAGAPEKMVIAAKDGQVFEALPTKRGREEADAPYPAEGLPEGMRIQTLYVPHDGTQYAEVENLLLLVEYGGKKLVFPGDAKPDRALFETIAAWSPVIDCLAAPFPCFGKRSVRRMIAQTLQIRCAALWHFPVPEKDASGWTQAFMRTCAQAEEPLPQMACLRTAGEALLL